MSYASILKCDNWCFGDIKCPDEEFDVDINYPGDTVCGVRLMQAREKEVIIVRRNLNRISITKALHCFFPIIHPPNPTNLESLSFSLFNEDNSKKKRVEWR